MSRIEFHVHVSDKLTYSCHLLRQACLNGARVAVVAEPEMLVALDDWLWRFSPVEFVPHCRAGASEASLAASPIVLTKSLSAPACTGRETAFNLGRDVPVGFEAFEHLIEIIATENDDIVAGRRRWKHYATLGHRPEKYSPSPSKEAP